VNNPGFQLLSLSSSEGHLPANPEFSSVPCILPNQLHIFATYGFALVITIISICVVNWLQYQSMDPLLPTTMKRRSDEYSADRRKPSSSKGVLSKRTREIVGGSITDFRKVGVMAGLWYLWLLWAC
jgi:hypothetical protein